jgi:hypothetical protein
MHLLALSVLTYPEIAALRFGGYVGANDSVHASISDNSCIVLQADNSNQL